MNVMLNGTSQDLSSGNLSEIVTHFCKNRRHVITELNGTIIPSERWGKTHLKEGDTLEIVTFVGGG